MLEPASSAVLFAQPTDRCLRLNRSGPRRIMEGLVLDRVRTSLRVDEGCRGITKGMASTQANVKTGSLCNPGNEQIQLSTQCAVADFNCVACPQVSKPDAVYLPNWGAAWSREQICHYLTNYTRHCMVIMEELCYQQLTMRYLAS